jgi:hypothetical protein
LKLEERDRLTGDNTKPNNIRENIVDDRLRGLFDADDVTG